MYVTLELLSLLLKLVCQPGQAHWSNPTRSNNKFELPVKGGIQKASNPKNHAPSRRGIPKTSATHQVWREKKKKKKTQPSASQTEPRTELTEPVYHITWNGMSKFFCSTFDFLFSLFVKILDMCP